MALALVGCGNNLSVATPEEIDAYPEARGIMESWQAMVDAADAKDCEAFQSYARKSAAMVAGDCEAAFAYMQDAPTIDWSKTQWDGTAGKGKIYESGRGDITSFILNEAEGTWTFDSAFWTE